MPKVVVLGTAHPHVFGLVDLAKKAGGLELVGVYDDDAARLAESAKKMAIPAIARLDAALALKPSLVIIGTVPSDRVRLAVAAMEAGAAALIDKPIAITATKLAELRKAQERTRRAAVAFYPYRGHPLLLAAKRALDAGRIGKLVCVMSCGPHKLRPATRPDWHWSAEHNGGVLIDVGSHHADICCWMAGAAPNWVCAQHDNFTQPKHPGFQDYAQAQLRFSSGAMGRVEVDWLNPESMKNFGDTRVWLQGTEGKIEVRLADEVSAFMWTHQQPMTPLDASGLEDHGAWEQRLIRELAEGKPGDIPQADVWRTSQVTFAMFESARHGGEPVRM